MPEQVINWQSDEESCSFTIKGMADLAMKMDQRTEPGFVSYASAGSSPFPFNLDFHIGQRSEGGTEVKATLNAKLNPMLKMMASRPLQNFVNLLVEKLKEVMESH
jgi:carbon monoxide dehydrogenase subunit G